MLSRQQEQAERKEILENDKRIREQGSTFLGHTHDDLAGGRFAKVSPEIVVGADPIVNYPSASAAHQIQLPDEPPLGFDNPELEPSSLASRFKQLPTLSQLFRLAPLALSDRGWVLYHDELTGGSEWSTCFA